MKRKGRAARGAIRGGLKKHGKSKHRDVLEMQEKEIAKINKATQLEANEKELAKQPHTFVIHRGSVGKYVKGLVMDLRKLMEPNTAKNLKVRKNNNIKDFVVNGTVLGVTNMIVLTSSDTSLQLRMIRFSQGPTLTFRVNQYSIARHIFSSQKRPISYEKLYKRSPLVIMNGFNQEGKKHLQLIQTFLQNMFPVINVDTLDLRNVKRCMMVNYNEENDTVELRHYPGQMSDSEFEGEQAEVELTQDIHKKGGAIRGEKSNVRKLKKRRETEEQQRVIRRLTNMQERKDREDAEEKAIIEKAARRQAAATGQTEEIENDRLGDREIAMNRARELGKENGEEGKKKPVKGKKRPTGEPLDYTRKKKKSSS